MKEDDKIKKCMFCKTYFNGNKNNHFCWSSSVLSDGVTDIPILELSLDEVEKIKNSQVRCNKCFDYVSFLDLHRHTCKTNSIEKRNLVIKDENIKNHLNCLVELYEARNNNRPLIAAIDLNIDCLCWVYGSDGLSILIEPLFKQIKRQNVDHRWLRQIYHGYYSAICNFLKNRYMHLYIGHFCPSAKSDAKTRLLYFKEILKNNINTDTISEKSTTALCHVCGHRNTRYHIGNKRIYKCFDCETTLLRDENAAINILKQLYPSNTPEPKIRIRVSFPGKKSRVEYLDPSVHLK